MHRQCVIHTEMALSPSLVQLKHHWISRPSDTLPPSHSQSYRFAACGRKQFPSLSFLNVKPGTFLVRSEIVQPQVVSLGMFYRTNKKVQHKPQALMCYRNNTLLSTIVQAEVLEKEKYIYRSPAEKEERCQKRQMDYIHTLYCLAS